MKQKAEKLLCYINIISEILIIFLNNTYNLKDRKGLKYMKSLEYNREKAIRYAQKWAYKRNPKYYNFDKIGGDCTNFISQCIYEGCNVMNYTKDLGWYYIDANNKSPSWSGVEFLYKFLTTNKGLGPFGEETSKEKIQIGDIIQLSFNGNIFEHSLIIVDITSKMLLSGIKIASHTYDSFGKRVSEYNFKKIRFIHILGANK